MQRTGVDIDGVLIHYEEKLFLEWCQRQLGWEIDLEAFASTHSWRKATGGKTGEEITPAFAEFMNQHPETQQLVNGADVALRQLCEQHELHAITARAHELRAATSYALTKYKVRHLFMSVSYGRLERKAEVISQHCISVHIEDSLSEIQPILASGLDVIIIQFPAFRGGREPYINDSRVKRLSACDKVPLRCQLEQKAELWAEAWQEVMHILTSEATSCAVA